MQILEFCEGWKGGIERYELVVVYISILYSQQPNGCKIMSSGWFWDRAVHEWINKSIVLFTIFFALELKALGGIVHKWPTIEGIPGENQVLGV